MKINQLVIGAVIIGFVIIVSGCTGAQPTPEIIYVTVTPQPSAEATPGSTPCPTPTSATPTPTPLPSTAPTATPTPTAAPTATPTPAPGQFVIPGRSVMVNVTMVNLHFTYKSMASDYFGPANQTLAGFVAKAGNVTNYTFTLTAKSSAIYSGSIQNVTIGPGSFNLLGMTSPDNLNMIEPTTSATITLRIQLPNSTYTGPLDVYILARGN